MQINNHSSSVSEDTIIPPTPERKVDGFFSRFLLSISAIFSSIANFFQSLSPWKKSIKVTPIHLDRQNNPQNQVDKDVSQQSTKANAANSSDQQPKLQDSSKKVDAIATPYITPKAPANINKPIMQIPVTWAQTISENKVALQAIAGLTVVAATTLYLISCYSRGELPTEILDHTLAPAGEAVVGAISSSIASVRENILTSDPVNAVASTVIPAILEPVIEAGIETSSLFSNTIPTIIQDLVDRGSNVTTYLSTAVPAIIPTVVKTVIESSAKIQNVATPFSENTLETCEAIYTQVSPTSHSASETFLKLLSLTAMTYVVKLFWNRRKTEVININAEVVKTTNNLGIVIKIEPKKSRVSDFTRQQTEIEQLDPNIDEIEQLDPNIEKIENEKVLQFRNLLAFLKKETETKESGNLPTEVNVTNTSSNAQGVGGTIINNIDNSPFILIQENATDIEIIEESRKKEVLKEKTFEKIDLQEEAKKIENEHNGKNRPYNRFDDSKRTKKQNSANTIVTAQPNAKNEVSEKKEVPTKLLSSMSFLGELKEKKKQIGEVKVQEAIPKITEIYNDNTDKPISKTITNAKTEASKKKENPKNTLSSMSFLGELKEKKKRLNEVKVQEATPTLTVNTNNPLLDSLLSAFENNINPPTFIYTNEDSSDFDIIDEEPENVDVRTVSEPNENSPKRFVFETVTPPESYSVPTTPEKNTSPLSKVQQIAADLEEARKKEASEKGLKKPIMKWNFIEVKSMETAAPSANKTAIIEDEEPLRTATWDTSVTFNSPEHAHNILRKQRSDYEEEDVGDEW